MKKYLSAFFQSFYSPEIYRDAIVKWKGLGGRYLVFLSGVLAIILAIGFYISLIDVQQKELPYIAKQVPEITIDNGVISVAAKQPVIIQDMDKKFTLFIDTEKSAEELRATKSQFAVGKNFFIIKNQNDVYQTVDLQKVKGKVLINEKNIYKFLSLFKVFALPLLWLGQIINLIMKVMVVTVLSYIVTAFMREEYNFTTRMRLSILALTPPLVISTVLSLAFNHDVAPWFFMLLACLFIYVMIVLMRRLPQAGNDFSQIV
jgi:hypothetical protein